MKNIFIKNKSILFLIVILIFSIVFGISYFSRENKTYSNKKQISKKTEKFLLGEWEVDKLLGFDPIQREISNYPNGQDILKNKIIFDKDFFSSKDISKYPQYQYEITDPIYILTYTYEKDDNLFFPVNSPLDARKSLNIKPNDIVQDIYVKNKNDERNPLSFLIVNNKRLIFNIDSVSFEMKKVK